MDPFKTALVITALRLLPYGYFLLFFRGRLAGAWELFFRGLAASMVLRDLGGLTLTIQLARIDGHLLSAVSQAALNASMIGNATGTAVAYLLAVLHWRANRRAG